MKTTNLKMVHRSSIASLLVLASLGTAGCGPEDVTQATDFMGKLKQATVYIENTARYEEKPGGTSVVSSTGSGFIIGTDGYLVTNAHVVGGAGTIKVYLRDENGNLLMEGDGATPQVYVANIKGVSECADLAVLKIDGGLAATPLEFYQGPIKEGLPVVAAGYPGALGKAFSSTTGVISSGTKPTGMKSSYPIAFGHEARINPGNSGGPLVEASTGKVIGVNFAGNTETDINYAISGLTGRPGYNLEELVNELKKGDIFSLGITGEVMVLEGAPMGIWVAAVRPGSPANEANIKPGDIIITLNNKPLNDRTPENYSAANYCQTVAGNDPSNENSVVPFTVITPEGLQLDGELNGTPLARPQSDRASSESSTTTPTNRHRDTYAMWGEFDSHDYQSDSGSYFDGYIFEATSGGEVSVEMRSSSVDSTLVVGLYAPDGESLERVIVRNDDIQAGVSDAKVTFTKERGRRYIIVATTYNPYEIGPYELIFAGFEKEEVASWDEIRAASIDPSESTILEQMQTLQ